MKPWIRLAVVIVLASSTVVWADIDFSQFKFRPFVHDRKQPKRSYVEELVKESPVTPPQIALAKPITNPLIMVAQAPPEHISDAEQIVTIRPTFIPQQQVKVVEASRTIDVDRAVVMANVWVEHHDTEAGLKLTNCDGAIDDNYPNPPLILECISIDEGTRYTAKSNRTARDGAYLWNYK